jgi:retron-type reverse transcriptase
VTWQEYETDLDEKLADLHRRLHQGTYRAQPSKRAYIPKPMDNNAPWHRSPGGQDRSAGRSDSPQPVFNFLGFTHICGNTRKTGRFIVKRKTIQKRLSAKLSELKAELRRRWHQRAAEVGKWLRTVVQGYFNYHAVPGNMDSLNSFRARVIWRWYRALRRRSQRHRITCERFRPLVDRWIPSAKILHPHPDDLRFDARYVR